MLFNFFIFFFMFKILNLTVERCRWNQILIKIYFADLIVCRWTNFNHYNQSRQSTATMVIFSTYGTVESEQVARLICPCTNTKSFQAFAINTKSITRTFFISSLQTWKIGALPPDLRSVQSIRLPKGWKALNESKHGLATTDPKNPATQKRRLANQNGAVILLKPPGGQLYATGR